ncbi:MAG: 2-phosphosulfolactate phosphatase [Flavobacteriales bacterium]|jgi:2-phosphosulfolactate phosphatase
MIKNKLEVCFSPNQFQLYNEHYDIVVVIDVLRATSAICAGFENGVKSIIPCSTVEEAMAFKNQGYVAAAEREGKIVPGFDFGNSPFSYMSDEVKGKEIALTTTNGTRAVNVAKSNGAQVVIGALSNLDAVVEWLLTQKKDVLLLCSGWKDKFNLEDTICAGAIAKKLIASGTYASEHDSTIAARFLFESAETNYFGFLKASSHRRRLRKLKLNKDIHYCLTANTTKVVPILVNDRLVLKKE